VHDIVGVSVFLMVFTAIIFFAPELGGYFLEYNNFIPADPLKTPPHIAPVWYFTPFYSMLRATTEVMTSVISLIVALAAAFAVWRTRLSQFAKPAVVGAAIVAIWLLGGFKALFGALGMQTLASQQWLAGFDAKFWGVVVMGGAVIILFFLPWLDRSPAKSIRYRPKWHMWLYLVFVAFFVALAYLGIQPPSVVGTYIAQTGTVFYFGFFLLMPWWSQLGHFRPVPDRVVYHAH
jgi:ubiquinol-cytochrome c reductase cytochrome b subunit